MAYVNLEAPAPGEVVNSLHPVFLFNYSVATATIVGVQVCSDPEMTAIVIESNNVANPTEWTDTEIRLNTSMRFVFPAAKLLPNGTYYWWAFIWDAALGVFRISDNRKIVIAGATYPFRLDNGTKEIQIVSVTNGIKEHIEIIGCGLETKKTFEIEFAAMSEASRDILKEIFDTNTSISLYDNENVQYFVYWGSCERNLSGQAFPPLDREFGISQSNHITGALRWTGKAIFTEV